MSENVAALMRACRRLGTMQSAQLRSERKDRRIQPLVSGSRFRSFRATIGSGGEGSYSRDVLQVVIPPEGCELEDRVISGGVWS